MVPRNSCTFCCLSLFTPFGVLACTCRIILLPNTLVVVPFDLHLVVPCVVLYLVQVLFLPFMRTPHCTFHAYHTFARYGAPCMFHVAFHCTVCTFGCSSNVPLVATFIAPFIFPCIVPFRCWFCCTSCAFPCTFILHVTYHPFLYLSLHRPSYLSLHCASVCSKVWATLPPASTHALASAPLLNPDAILCPFLFFFSCRACASGNHLEVMRLSPGNVETYLRRERRSSACVCLPLVFWSTRTVYRSLR